MSAINVPNIAYISYKSQISVIYFGKRLKIWTFPCKKYSTFGIVDFLIYGADPPASTFFFILKASIKKTRLVGLVILFSLVLFYWFKKKDN